MSVLSERLAAPRRKRIVKNPLPWYTPRFWHGMRFSTWMSVLARNNFAVSLSQLHTAASITLVSAINSTGSAIDSLVHGRRLARTEITEPPVFILGHWRAGTTFLHEILIRDPAHTYPTTYQCFVPHHFLLTEKWLAPMTKMLLPKRRPMDNMAAGWKRPQEDEFALGNLGVPSPYLSMIFPNRGPVYPEYLDLHELSPRELRRWQNELDRFFRRITLRDQRRIIVKSPPHTARVRTLLELFPNAKFVHLVRNPYELYVSTVSLWKSLNMVQRMQAPGEQEWVEEYVLSSFERMYNAFNRDKELLAENQLYELRYEDLVKEPLEQIRQIYQQLQLGDFSRMKSATDEYLAAVKNYRPNHYELPEDKIDTIRKRWQEYFENYGYDL